MTELTTLDEDDLDGHLFRAGCAAAPPEMRAASKRALGKLYKAAVEDAVAERMPLNTDPRLKDWFTRTSYAIMCIGDDPVAVARRLFGNRPPGRKAKNADRDFAIALAVARLVYAGVPWDTATADVAESESQLSDRRVREIYRRNRREALTQIWATEKPYEGTKTFEERLEDFENQFKEWLAVDR